MTDAKDGADTGAGASAAPGELDQVWAAIREGLEKTVGGIKVEMDNLGKSIKDIFKSIGQSVYQTLTDWLGKKVNSALKTIFSGLFKTIFPTVNAAAKGGPLTPGVPTLVGEEGPELILPTSAGTVLTASQTAKALAGSAVQQQAGGQARGNTSVIINNHSGQPAQASRRSGPDGSEIIDIVIGRVAENLARGGEVADAAALRFGLSAQGT